jgi:Cd2+/Zn2+-exporting ATPase
MDILDDLTAIGLTEYEARVYLALLRESPTNGYQLSKKTGVPRSMVYEALGRLHARGAVLKSGDAKATLYQPVPPNLLLDRYQQEQQNLIDNLRGHLQTWYSGRSEDLLWSIVGKGPVFSYANQMISETREEIFLVLNDQALEQVRSTLEVVCGKSIFVGVLLTGNAELQCAHLAYHPPLESELQGLGNLLLITSDGGQC